MEESNSLPEGNSSVAQEPTLEQKDIEGQSDILKTNPELTEGYKPKDMRKQKKKHGCLVAILIVILLVGVTAIGLYFCLPGLRKPNDLGIKASQEAYDSAIRKLTAKVENNQVEVIVDTVEEEYSSSYTATEVSAALTSEEVTSLLTINRPEDYPLQETQVRLSEDDTMEVSTAMDVSFLLEDILDNEITKEEIAQTIPVLKDLPEEVNVYIKLDASVEMNEVKKLNIVKLSVMGVTIPDNMIASEDAGEFLIDSINGYLMNKEGDTGERYDVLQVEDGNLLIEGAIKLP